MSMFEKYLQIKELFIKFTIPQPFHKHSTTIPTSAPVERYLVKLLLCLPLDEIVFMVAY